MFERPDRKGGHGIAFLLGMWLYLFPQGAWAAPVITTQPANVISYPGTSETFHVSASSSGGTLFYQWFLGPSGDTSTPIGAESHSPYEGLFLPEFDSLNINHWVRVRDNNGSVDSVTAVITSRPARPEEVIATRNLFQDRIRVSWNVVLGSSQYDVYRSTSAQGVPSLIATVVTPVFHDMTAVPGTTYFYRVKARDSENDESDFSSTTSGVRATAPFDGTLIPLSEASDFTFTESGTELLISLKSGFLERYNLNSSSITASYYLGGTLYGMDIAPADTFALVATNVRAPSTYRLHKVDLATGQISSLIISPYNDEVMTYDVVILSENFAMYVPDSRYRNNCPAILLNLQTGNISIRSGIPLVSHLARSANRQAVALYSSYSPGDCVLYNAVTDSFGGIGEIGPLPSGGAVSRDGALYSVNEHQTGAVIFNSAGSRVRTIHDVPSHGQRFAPHLNELIVADSDQDRIRIFNVSTGAEVESQPIGEDIWFGSQFEEGQMEISPDGTRLALLTDAGIRLYRISVSGPPPFVTEVAATDSIFDDRVRVTWGAAASAEGYIVYRHTTNNSAAATILNSNVTGLQFDDLTAVPTIPYYYWVKAKNRAGNSPFSVSALGQRGLPAPSSFDTSSPSQSQVSLTWSYESIPGDFEIYRGVTDQFAGASLLATCPHDARTYVDTTAELATVYHYWIRKLSSPAPSAFSGPIQGYRQLAPPAGITATSNLSSKVTINWQAVPGALQYEVYSKTTATGFNGSERLVGITSNTTIDDVRTNVTAGPVNYWSVRARAGIIDSPFPNGAAGRRTIFPPQTVTATTDLLDRITLSWSNENDGATHYRVYRSETNNVNTAILVQNVAAPTTQWAQMNPIANVTYYYWVKAFSFQFPGSEGEFSTTAIGRRPGLQYSDYHQLHSLTGDNAVITNDPDSDGYSNLAEWALGGTSPLVQSALPQVPMHVQTIAGETYMTFSYLRLVSGTQATNAYQVLSLRYEAEGTGDLLTWNLAGISVPPPSGLAAPPAGYEWGCFRLPGTLTQYPRGFLRLKVTHTP